MSHGIRRFSRNGMLHLARPPLRRIKPWCEWIALVAAIVLTYSRLRTEIGNWQALLASAGVPLAVLEGPWDGRLVARRVSRRLRSALGGLSRPGSDVERIPSLWVSPTPHGIFISGSDRSPIGVMIPVPWDDDRSSSGGPRNLPDQGVEFAADRAGVMATPAIGRSQHCVLFAVDIAQFTAPGRDDEVQLAVRDALYRLLIESFEGSGISWRSCIHEDRGDGAVVVIPAHMPTITVIDPLVEQIHVRLRRYNRLASAVAQVRLRLAVHIGEVYRDGHGLAGKAVNDLFRMLDAPDLRQAVQASETGLALIVSDYLYQSVIHGGPGNTNPSAYAEVLVRVKQFQARAWLQIPG
jgi:hypothetical protein